MQIQTFIGMVLIFNMQCNIKKRVLMHMADIYTQIKAQGGPKCDLACK